MQPQKNGPSDFKQQFNIVFWIFLILQRGLVVPMRKNFGKEALGMPAFLSLVLMVLWSAFTRDAWMWLWIGLWLICLAKRRMETFQLLKSGTRLHSYYDGESEAMWFAKTERAAKLVGEPLLVGILGGMLYWIYQENGLPVVGLPYFLLTGVVTLPFVEIVKQRIWEKRIQGTQDARIEQEAMVRESRERYGE